MLSPLSSAGTYRVFIVRKDLLFIQIEGGTKSVLAALAPLFGPAGGLIPLGLWLFTKTKTRHRTENLDQKDPEDLLRDNDHNFKLHLAEIREAAIEPASWVATSGKAGRLTLMVRHGEKFKFEFENTGEMAKAMQFLAPLLTAALTINVEWNGEKQRYQGKKTV